MFDLEKRLFLPKPPSQIELGSWNLVYRLIRNYRCAFARESEIIDTRFGGYQLLSLTVPSLSLKNVVFSLIFHVIVTKKTKTVHRRGQMRGEGRISTKSVLVSQEPSKTIFSHVRFLFLFFPPTIKIIYSLLDTDQNRSNSVNRFSLTADYIYMSGDELGSKLNYAPIWRRGWKSQNSHFFKPIDRKWAVV